jgi:Protein of unknown function (DUF2971)
MQLYKYVDISKPHNIEALQNAQLWFANPFTFNDPFDCNLDEVDCYSQDHAAQYLSKFNNEKVDKKTRDYILNNPSKLRDSALKSRSNVLSKSGVLSLSKCNDSLLMWSHYANSHAGIALGFNPDFDEEFFTHLLEVNYCESYDPINYAAEDQQAINKILQTKHKGWEYEQELRVIKTPIKILDNKYSRLFGYKKEALTEIYFGLKTPQQEVEKIQNICATNQLKHVVFHQAEKVPNEFRLTFKSVK